MQGLLDVADRDGLDFPEVARLRIEGKSRSRARRVGVSGRSTMSLIQPRRVSGRWKL